MTILLICRLDIPLELVSYFFKFSKKKVDIYENVSNLFECIDFINNKNNKIQINYFLKSIKFILLSLVGDDFYINYFNNFDRVK